MSYHLLTYHNPKTLKGEKNQYSTLILHLAPNVTSGYNVCASSSPQCRQKCLSFSGRGRYTKTQLCRINKTKMWFEQPKLFKSLVIADIHSHIKRCQRLGMRPAIRLNGTSDIVWEQEWPELFTMFPQVQFYDYTKHYWRCLKSYHLPKNYYLVFSESEVNDRQVRSVLRSGKCNVATVFTTKTLPRKHRNKKVVNGDKDDLRFLDPVGVIVGLKYKRATYKYAKGIL